MRKILLVVGLAAVATPAMAQQDVWSMHQLHSGSCPTVNITSGTVIEMTGNDANQYSGKVYALSVINPSTSADIFCSDDAAVATSGAKLGVPIMRASSATAQPNWFQWLLATSQLWYCITNNAGGSVAAKVCQYK